MRYISTRGGSKGRSYSFTEAVLLGWAHDGGMLLPETVPQVASEQLQQWRNLSYPALCEAILRLFMADTDLPDLAHICQRAFSTFGAAEVVRAVQVQGASTQPLHLLELWHGPTLAFKDLGMQVLCQALQSLLTQDAGRRTVLVSTSGDTGPSALAAVQNAPALHCVVLYPIGRISRVQEAQMLSERSAANTTVVACEGTSDDMDIPCLEVFQDEAFRTKHCLGSVNSVNALRLLVQVVHFFYAYLRVTAIQPLTEPLAEVSFVIPTGAAGHVTAGLIAKLMGLPISKLVMAVNANDVLHTMMRDGVLDKGADVHHTASPAMDIQAPYNVERMFHLLTSGNNTEDVAQWMRDFNSGKSVTIPLHLRDRFKDVGLTSVRVSDAAAAAAVRHVYNDSDTSNSGSNSSSKSSSESRSSYIVDPHTAVGVAAALQLQTADQTDKVLLVCMGCAHPAKFAETVAAALEMTVEQANAVMPDQSHKCVAATITAANSIDAAAVLAEGSVPVYKQGDDWLAMLKDIIVSVTAAAESK